MEEQGGMMYNLNSKERATNELQEIYQTFRMHGAADIEVNIGSSAHRSGRIGARGSVQR